MFKKPIPVMHIKKMKLYSNSIPKNRIGLSSMLVYSLMATAALREAMIVPFLPIFAPKTTGSTLSLNWDTIMAAGVLEIICVRLYCQKYSLPAIMPCKILDIDSIFFMLPLNIKNAVKVTNME